MERRPLIEAIEMENQDDLEIDKLYSNFAHVTRIENMKIFSVFCIFLLFCVFLIIYFYSKEKSPIRIINCSLSNTESCLSNLARCVDEFNNCASRFINKNLTKFLLNIIKN
jgi:hypothetical protein